MSQPEQNPQPIPLTFVADNAAVQSYLDTLQNIIARMANNSSNCKTWCITLVSAILVVIVDKKVPNYSLVAYIPVILFFHLDAYYLGQEQAFRAVYNNFVKRLHANKATTQELFRIRPLPAQEIPKAIIKAIFSVSIWPFYGVLAIVIIIAHRLLSVPPTP